MTIEFEGSLNRLLNPADPDRGCSCSSWRLGTTVQFISTSSLKFQASRLSIGFSVTNYARDGGQLRVLSSDGRFNVGRAMFNGSS